MSADQRKRYDEVVLHLRSQCGKAGVTFDTYDIDYIMGALMTWLGHHDAALTAHGVKRIKRDK